MPICRKHNLATFPCPTCKGTGRYGSLLTASLCTRCKHGQQCPKCGKHWK